MKNLLTSGFVELIISNIGWPTGTISGKNIHGSFWLMVNISSKGISIITCEWIDKITPPSVISYRFKYQPRSTKPTICEVMHETDPSTAKRFNIFGSVYSKSIRSFFEFNSISSHASDISYLIEVGVCWFQLRRFKGKNGSKD